MPILTALCCQSHLNCAFFDSQPSEPFILCHKNTKSRPRFLPSVTVVAKRLCFHRCLSVHRGVYTHQQTDTPWQADTPPWQADTPPWQADTPPWQVDTPGQTPGRQAPLVGKHLLVGRHLLAGRHPWQTDIPLDRHLPGRPPGRQMSRVDKSVKFHWKDQLVKRNA